MKKQLLITAALMTAGAAFATTIDSTAIGSIPVSVTAGKQMVAIPFVAADGSSGINVADLVATSTLANGDKLYAWNGTNYDCWVLENKVWKPTKKYSVTSAGITQTSSAAADSSPVARGDAFWLETKATTAYLVGYPASRDTVEVSISVGWNLIGSASVSDGKTLSDITGEKGEKIVLSNGTKYEHTGAAWAQRGTSLDPATVTLAAGQGFWYYAKSAKKLSL